MTSGTGANEPRRMLLSILLLVAGCGGGGGGGDKSVTLLLTVTSPAPGVPITADVNGEGISGSTPFSSQLTIPRPEIKCDGLDCNRIGSVVAKVDRPFDPNPDSGGLNACIEDLDTGQSDCADGASTAILVLPVELG
jgi:hypothetical protein